MSILDFSMPKSCFLYIAILTYFRVEGKTSATGLSLGLFMAGRYSHVEPPIVKHSTELRR